MIYVYRKERPMIMKYRFAALAALLALFAGCTTGAVKHDTGTTVEQRAVQRWNYLIAHEAGKAWDYLSPGYRKTITHEAYAATMNNRPVKWESVKYDTESCTDDRCVVTLYVGYSLPIRGIQGPVESGSPQQETWIRVDGSWYFLPSS